MNSARSLLVLMVLAFVAAGCTSMGNSADQAYDWLSESRPDATAMLPLAVDGTSVPTTIYYPEGYSKVRRFPALILLGADSAPLQPSLRDACRKRGYVLACPDIRTMITLMSKGEPEAMALKYLDAIMDALVIDHAIAPSRIFLVGTGDGANLSGHLACMRTHNLGGLALINGGAPLPGCRPVRPIPTIIFSSSGLEDGSARAASFWAHNNGCSPMSLKIQRKSYTKERYECTSLGSGVQRYILYSSDPGGRQDASNGGASSLSTAWTLVDFFSRETGN